MKTISTIALCLLTGLAGIALGAFAAVRLGFAMADTGMLTGAEADLAVQTQLLRYIQSDENSRATELLQIQLDGALVTIDAFASEGSKLNPKTYARLRRVREMRERSGYRPADAGVASAVERALVLGEARP
ncbi:MAG TPA: hypothetical protein VFV69_16465 [Steroidobacteraceae bacterium]|nr:hypothetical protein [Steroidobacteraceae bacterium]